MVLLELDLLMELVAFETALLVANANIFWIL